MIPVSRLFAIIAVTVGGLVAAYAIGAPLSIGFVAGLLQLMGMSLKQGTPFRMLLTAMGRGVQHTKEVIWILLMVGILIPSWTASGTIPYLIDTGLTLLDPAYFVTFAFLFSAVISMTLGTSTGTLSAVGIPLIGIAHYLQIPIGIVAGALVSGAFVGDRTSPFSSAHQLLAASTGTTVKRQFPFLAPTTLLAIGACILFYGACDLLGGWGQGRDLSGASIYADAFRYSPLLWIPLMLLLGVILLRQPTKYGFLVSSAAAIVLGSILQGVEWGDWVHYVLKGYASPDQPALHSKGLTDMIDLVVLIGMAGAFNGILEETRMIEPYMEKLLGRSQLMLPATLRTSLFGFGLDLLSCTQTLPIMMTGRNLLPLWQKKFPNEHLSRVVADAPLVLAALVPWNLITILCTTILGVPWEQYAIFAVFLWSLPILTIAVSGFYDWKHASNRSRADKNLPHVL